MLFNLDNNFDKEAAKIYSEEPLYFNFMGVTNKIVEIDNVGSKLRFGVSYGREEASIFIHTVVKEKLKFNIPEPNIFNAGLFYAISEKDVKFLLYKSRQANYVI